MQPDPVTPLFPPAVASSPLSSWMHPLLAASSSHRHELGRHPIVVHAKPPASSVVSFGGPGAGAVVRYVEADLRRIVEEVVERARRLCVANSMHGLVEVIEGDPRYVLRNAIEKHHADLLVIGSHGYSAIKRALLGSERLLRPPRVLLRDDRQATQVQ